MKTFTNQKIQMGDTSRTKVQRISSKMGDAILQCDKTGPEGEILATEIVMFVPKLETVSIEELELE